MVARLFFSELAGLGERQLVLVLSQSLSQHPFHDSTMTIAADKETPFGGIQTGVKLRCVVPPAGDVD